jgi:hypothetical protein
MKVQAEELDSEKEKEEILEKLKAHAKEEDK